MSRNRPANQSIIYLLVTASACSPADTADRDAGMKNLSEVIK